jgi:hypothetical protein
MGRRRHAVDCEVVTEREQQTAFAGDLDKLVARYRAEFQMSYASVIGCLHLMAAMLAIEANEDE